MSAYGTFSLLRDPKGLANTVGAAHTPRSPRGRVQENLLHPYHRALGRLQPVKAAATRLLLQALTGFSSVRFRFFATPRRWRGGQGDEVAFYP